MSVTRTTAILTALLVVASVGFVPGAVSAEEHLAVETTQGSFGGVHVLVNGSDGPVAGATVTVEAVDANESYVGNGSYETDENGTVTLDRPTNDVTVWVNATNGSDSVSTQAHLLAPTLDVAVTQHDDASATVTVTYAITGDAAEGAAVNVSAVDGAYAGVGSDYETDTDGTVGLTAPEQTVEIRVEATAGELTGSTTTTLQNQSTMIEDSNRSFGDWMSAYVQKLLDDLERGTGGIGHMVAGFATENNPGNAPDHAGPKDDTGPPTDAGPAAQGGNVTDAGAPAGGPSGAQNGGPSDGGPPEDAGKPDHAGGSGGGNAGASASGNGKAKGRK